MILLYAMRKDTGLDVGGVNASRGGGAVRSQVRHATARLRRNDEATILAVASSLLAGEGVRD